MFKNATDKQGERAYKISVKYKGGYIIGSRNFIREKEFKLETDEEQSWKKIYADFMAQIKELSKYL